jgi:outer membrane lipoprotein SlyB
MQEEEKKEIKAIEKHGKILADIVGRTVAPIVGMIAAGPIGAIAGGVVGTLIKYGTEEFLNRFLTPKEIRRVGTSAEFIVTSINERLNQGASPHEAFFAQNENGVFRCRRDF